MDTIAGRRGRMSPAVESLHCRPAAGQPMEDPATLGHAVDMMAEGFAFVGPDGKIVFCNRALVAMAAGLPVAGRPFAEIVVAKELSSRWSTLHDGFDAGLARGDGSIVAVRVALRPVRSVCGAAFCALVTTRVADLESALERKNEDLQRLSRQVLTVQETERKRIAADLHDCLGQSLSAVKFGLETVSAALDAGLVEDARGTMASVMSTVKDALSDVRRLAMNLRPSMLDDLGVISTLSWFAREFRAIYRGIAVETSFEVSEGDVDERLKVAIFRIVQEAMNNVAKHSRASRVLVSLRHEDGGLLLVIEDDGIGFDPREVASRRGEARRHGHACSRERVEWTGGRFSIVASPGGGVRICAWWRMARADGKRAAEAGGKRAAETKSTKRAPVAEVQHAGSITNPDRRRPHAPALGPARPAGAGS